MQQPAVRLYVNPGCPFCAQAEHFLRTEQIPGDMVAVGRDPILEAGIIKHTPDGRVSVPILVSYVTNQIIVGWRPDQYVEIADAVHKLRREQALTSVIATSNHPGEAPAVAQAEAPTVEGATGMPDVPGGVVQSGSGVAGGAPKPHGYTGSDGA